MRRIAGLVTMALCGAAAFGQTLLDCVEPDVLRSLVLQGQGDPLPVISASVPQELSGLRMPGGFTWIGSVERRLGGGIPALSANTVAAAWRSNVAPEAARTAAAGALAASGWQVLPPFDGGRMIFTSSSFPVSQTACRDGLPVTINASAMDGVTYVLLNIQRGNINQSSCNQSRPALASNTGLERYLPRLDLPQDPRTGASVTLGSGGTSFAGNAVNARAEFTLGDSAPDVARHFARQMAEQGWSSDVNWSGAATAGSSWSRRAEDGGLVQATLTVTAVAERRILAALRLGRLQ